MSRSTRSSRPTQSFGVQSYLGMRIIPLLVITGLLLIGFCYHIIAKSAEEDLDLRVASLANEIKKETTRTIYQQAHFYLASLSQGLIGGAQTLGERMVLLPVLHTILSASPIVHSIFVGYENGDLFMVVNLDTEEKRKEYRAPSGTAILVVNIRVDADPHIYDNLYFTSGLELISQTAGEQAFSFDPRLRPWYKPAFSAQGMVRAGPILLFQSDMPATVFAHTTRNGAAVVGLAMLLSDLSAMLKSELPSPGSRLTLFRDDGVPIASDKSILATERDGRLRLRDFDDFPSSTREGVRLYREGKHGDGIHHYIGNKEWLLSVQEIQYGDEFKNFMVLSVPRDEIFSDARTFLKYSLLAMAAIILLSIPIIMNSAQRIIRPLKEMVEHARNPHESDGDGKREVKSGMEEIDTLAQGIFDLQDYLGKILAITGIIGTERDMSKLIRQVFQQAVSISGADGGGMVLADEHANFDKEGMYYWLGGKVEMSPVPDDLHDSEAHPQAVFASSMAERRAIRVSLTRDHPWSNVPAIAPGFADPETERFDLYGMALRDRTGTPLGAMSFFYRYKAEGCDLSPGQITFLESMGATVSVVLETQKLIENQYNLRDALIHIIAGAIDAKSAYTGGHCARVPIIFQMLLEAACDTREGPLAEFELNENGWEAARLAGWLHDCGKVTTPEYVMDKATKLETLYDRIHEIRTRFEVLKRDAEIAFHKAVNAGADAEAEAEKLEAEWAALDDDFAFIASCNSGEKHMDGATLERLSAVGRRRWLRTLDKKLGVSRGERARMDKGAVSVPPALEPILGDYPEHIIHRGPKDTLDPDNPWGIKVHVPEYLYNRGEMYNLSIPRGTLTPEERYKINDHITQTIIMLSRMPLPRELADVPEIAGAHHETMDGKGYPRRLDRSRMSWAGRMMAIADIFEALTAWDRPYKSSKTVSEALRIMATMRDNMQIDPDLYELFLRSSIPQRYAEQHLKPEQNDIFRKSST